ncbi:hypothetical protein G9A89_017954 [Geosiphon pyriformis]|nr:hypothetical protein G9A89_017954 [Geosiphon pyriformis]
MAVKPLERKLHKLNEQVIKHDGVVELNSDLFDEFLAKPRNYSFVVLLTALDSSINCQPCREFDPEFRLVARSWQTTKLPSRLYFGILDFKNGREIFTKLKQTTAPSCWYYPATDGSFAKDVSEPDRYDFATKGFGGENFASYLAIQLGTSVPVKRPPNYSLMMLISFFLIGALAVFKLIFPTIQKAFQNKNTWAALSLVIILMMISGHMWNHIRTPPYITSTGGSINYVAAGFQSQYGLESQIVAILCKTDSYKFSIFKLHEMVSIQTPFIFGNTDGFCAFSVVSLIVSVPKFENKTKQRFGVYLWMGILIVMFSFLFALFRIKYPGYPFRLFI